MMEFFIFTYRPNNLQNKSILKDLAPENEDEQEVPRKVKNIMKNQQQVQKKREKKKMKKRIDIGILFKQIFGSIKLNNL